MTSTDELDSLGPASSTPACRGTIPPEVSQVIPSRAAGNTHNLGLRCKACSCGSGQPGLRYVIPEASPAFRETMGKMKSEQVQSVSTISENTSANNVTSTSTSLSSPTSSPTSFLNRLKLAFKTSSTSSSQKCSNNAGQSKSLSSMAGKNGNSRRPASFGGADVVKPWTGRRASQYEKRVSWADERGSDKALYTVRLIKPRLSTESKRARQVTPGQSILRNSGAH